MGQFTLPLLGFIALDTNLLKRDFVFEHKVDGAGDFVGSGDQGLSRPQLSAFEAKEGAKSGVGAGDGGSRLSKGLPGPIVGFKGAGTQDFTAGNIVVRGQA